MYGIYEKRSKLRCRRGEIKENRDDGNWLSSLFLMRFLIFSNFNFKKL